MKRQQEIVKGSIFMLFFTLIILTYFIFTNRLAKIDFWLITHIQADITPLRTLVMKIFTEIGSTHYAVIIILLFIAFLYWYKVSRKILILFIIVVATTPIVNGMLKYTFQRERPIFYPMIEQGGYSFPSGHAMNAFVLYTMIACILVSMQKNQVIKACIIILCSVFILLIGLSRIYLGVHYPTDIIGGYLFGAIWLLIIIYFLLIRRKERS